MNTIEHWQEVFSDALASDLEHGVKWLNERAWDDFRRNYPELYNALQHFFEVE